MTNSPRRVRRRRAPPARPARAFRRRHALERVPKGRLQRHAGAVAGDNQPAFLDAGGRADALALSGRASPGSNPCASRRSRFSLASASVNWHSALARPNTTRLAAPFAARSRLSRSLRARRRLITSPMGKTRLSPERVDGDDLVARSAAGAAGGSGVAVSSFTGSGLRRRRAGSPVPAAPGSAGRRAVGALASWWSSSTSQLMPTRRKGRKHRHRLVGNVERFRHGAERQRNAKTGLSAISPENRCCRMMVISRGHCSARRREIFTLARRFENSS